MSYSDWGGSTSEHISLGFLKLLQPLPSVVGWGTAQQVNACILFNVIFTCLWQTSHCSREWALQIGRKSQYT